MSATIKAVAERASHEIKSDPALVGFDPILAAILFELVMKIILALVEKWWGPKTPEEARELIGGLPRPWFWQWRLISANWVIARQVREKMEADPALKDIPESIDSRLFLRSCVWLASAGSTEIKAMLREAA